jgi:hypothetical protein
LEYCLEAFFRFQEDTQSGKPAQNRAFRHNLAKFLDLQNLSGRMQMHDSTLPRIMNLV